MLPSSTFLLLAALIPSISAQVRFTKPDIDKKLNLSSESITIAWAVDNGVAEAQQVVDIWWQNDQTFGYQLVANYSNAAGTNSYAWNPQDVVDALHKSNNLALPSGKNFQFELRFHGRNDSRGSRIRSESYAVEGYSPMQTGAGPRVRADIGAALFAGVVGLGMLVI
ncbi:hypothetical protein B0T16DRAFT_423394 [Cercophora newfieldiana]|uniref:Uncharacterized protein n=1 Tax=Cercophora newfieldiana TaxID=92897 RepID=A0AA39XUX6_9PEZI|nr:hypothetical protein B0T16DRAFT_423394 [Cercophora newfieldiana]